MKNFPHQFNDISKLLGALRIIQELSENNIPITDENFGERLARDGIYTYRDKSLSFDEYLRKERKKPPSNRGYLTVARDIRRLFELLGFIHLSTDKTAILTRSALQLVNATNDEERLDLWRRAFLQLGLEGSDGEISHPYRILLNLVNTIPGIDTSKLLLALEAENDSEEEFERILNLAKLDFEEIVEQTETTVSMARNAVKILPAIAEQLGDIERIQNRAYPVGQAIITEDEITSVETVTTRPRQQYWGTSSEEIAKEPVFKKVIHISIDLSDAIRIRQKRLSEHQKCVKLLAELNEEAGFDIFEGKFDCLAVQGQSALLYEVKTLSSSLSDQEGQTIKGVGQLKYYNFSIVQNQMGLPDVQEIIVFSKMPSTDIIEFCNSINILVVWCDGEHFKFRNPDSNQIEIFEPANFI